MEVLVFIILIISGILNSILFFKVWKMTNNVKKIFQRMSIPSKEVNYPTFDKEYSEFLYYIYNNEKEKAKEFVQKHMWNTQTMTRMINAYNTQIFDENHEELKKEYKEWYELLGEEFPTYSHMRERLKK